MSPFVIERMITPAIQLGRSEKGNLVIEFPPGSEVGAAFELPSGSRLQIVSPLSTSGETDLVVETIPQTTGVKGGRP